MFAIKSFKKLLYFLDNSTLGNSNILLQNLQKHELN